MELIIIAVLSILMPVLAITAFVIGYNVNAPRKILRLPEKKRKPTEDELMLERIEKAQVYKTEN